MYIPRTLEQYVHKLAVFFPVLLVCGPRRAGKTTLLQVCSNRENRGRTLVSLENLDNRHLAQSDPGLFLQRYPPPLILDEIHHAPNLFPSIKALVDRKRQAGMFWMTSSRQFAAFPNLGESLAGRLGLLHLQGLTQAERAGHPLCPPFLPQAILSAGGPVRCNRTGSVQALAADTDPQTGACGEGSIDVGNVWHSIWQGSWPKLHAVGASPVDATAWKTFHDSLVRTCLADIRQSSSGTGELVFWRFLQVLAARTGTLLNCSDMAREVGVSAPTIRSWIRQLEAAGLVLLLPPCRAGGRPDRSLVRTPMVHFLDAGLACALAGWIAPGPLACGLAAERMLKSFVVAEIVKSWWHNGRRPGSCPSLHRARHKERKLRFFAPGQERVPCAHPARKRPVLHKITQLCLFLLPVP